MNKTTPAKIRLIVVGDSGNLSLSIQDRVRVCPEKFNLTLVSSSLVRDSWQKGNLAKTLNTLLPQDSEDYWMINTCGITNSATMKARLNDVNCGLHTALATLAVHKGYKFVSVGTIMENFPKICLENPYLYSKYQALQGIKSLKALDYLHLQIHTLYGGKKLHDHMFLGQLYNSVKRREDFHMSTGSQLREYHHINDDVDILLRMVESGVTGVRSISSGEPLTLINLATKVYEHFLPNNRIHCDLQSPKNEQFFQVFPKLNTFDYEPVHFRDALNGIIEDFIGRLT